MARKRAAKDSTPRSTSKATSRAPRDESSSGLTLRHTLRGHSGKIGKLAWSPDGHTLASPSEDGTVRLWDATTGKAKQVLHAHKEDVISVAWSPDGQRLASASTSHRDKQIHILDPKEPGVPKALNDGEAWDHTINHISWSPNGETIAAATAHYSIPVWKVSNGSLNSILRGHAGYINCVA